MVDSGVVVRGFRFPLDPSRAQERLLASYAGAARFAFNWALSQVKANLGQREAERSYGVPEAELTPTVGWSFYALSKLWNAHKDQVAPWWREVSKHAPESGLRALAAALKNWKDSRTGARAGRPVGFPGFRKKSTAPVSLTFVEFNGQVWLHPGRRHVRLMLPAAMRRSSARRVKDAVARLEWVHTTESTRRLARLVQAGRASIQAVTISRRGGRWWVSYQVRITAPAPVTLPKNRPGGVVGVDAGIKNLATCSTPVPGLTGPDGTVHNPRPLTHSVGRLARLDRAIARTRRGSKNRARLLTRRARLHGTIAQTRALAMHRLTTALARGFDTIVVEDLNVAGMGRNRRLARAIADAGLGELRRQLAYKTTSTGATLVLADRFYPSSKTCSGCGSVRAKLTLSERTYACTNPDCGLVIDRDVNAARNLALYGQRALAGLRPDRLNGDPRPGQTTGRPVAPAA